jgi:hypothetical protein
MQHHAFSDNSPYEPQWVFAASVRPTSHVVRECCPECGRSGKYPAGSFDVTVEGGSAFPDFLGCGAYPLLIVSEHVVSIWQRAGVASFQMFPVGVVSLVDSTTQQERAPKYFHVEITGTCMVDLVKSGIRLTGACRRCAQISREPMSGTRLKLLEGSWDGSPLFRDHRLFPRVSFCTEQLKSLLETEGVTNVRFEAMG